jgi:hypothetical protein
VFVGKRRLERILIFQVPIDLFLFSGIKGSYVWTTGQRAESGKGLWRENGVYN